MVKERKIVIHQDNSPRPISKLGLPIFLLFLNLFFFRKMGNTGFAILSSGFYLFILVASGYKETLSKQRRLAIGSLGIIILNGLLLISKANGFATMVLALVNIFSIVLFACLLKDRLPFVASLFHLLTTPLNFGLSYLWGGLTILEKIISVRMQETKRGLGKKQILSANLKSYLLGFIISIPVIFILLNLLSGADPIFASFVKKFFGWIADLFSGDIWQNLLNRLIISVILGVFLSPLLYFFGKKNLIRWPQFLGRVAFDREMTVLLSLVAITLLAFIIIQWPYVFVTVPFETDLSKYGVATYSEYVKKGFGEFMLISVIVYSLLWAGLLVLRVCANMKRSLLYYLQLLVTGEFAVILLSVFRRIYLYQAYHGWSLGRIYGGIFLVWVSLITLILVLRHFKKAAYIRYEAIATALVILFIGIFNAENFIATVHPPTVNKRVDYVYLSRMSADGTAGWLMAYQQAKKILEDQNLASYQVIGKLDRTQILYAGMILKNLTENYHNLVSGYADSQELRSYYKEILLAYRDGEKGIISCWPFVGTDFEAEARPPVTFYTFLLESDPYYKILAKKQKENTFDKLFTWNKSRWIAYEVLRKNIGVSGLIKLQKKYIQVHEKISKQDSGQRDIEMDISLQSPFL